MTKKQAYPSPRPPRRANPGDIVKSEVVELCRLQPNKGQIPGVPKNPRFIKDDKFRQLCKSLEDDPEMTGIREIVVYPFKGAFVIVGGTMRYHALKELGFVDAIVKVLRPDTTPDKIRRFILKDNSAFGEYDWDAIANEWDAAEVLGAGIDLPDHGAEENAEKEREEKELKALTNDFFYPPFSLLDTTKGLWLKRREQWYDIGLDSAIGRDDQLIFSKSSQSVGWYKRKNELRAKLGREPTTEEVTASMEAEGKHIFKATSIFDPVLAEICYRWFNIPHGKILDPFAGGSVRGVVAAYLQMPYHGNDLSQRQVEANRRNLAAIPQLALSRFQPVWTQGDSAKISEICTKEERNEGFDMVFSCPPYGDLEKYSDDPADISNMPYERFLQTYRDIIARSCSMLKPGRFAVFVIGDIRDPQGRLRDFPGDTIRAFQDAGLAYLNQIIVVNNVGSGTIRARGNFRGRKIVKRHQNVIVCWKGTTPQAKLEEYEQLHVKKELENFNDMRSPFALSDYVLTFYKGDPKEIKSLFPETAVMPTDGEGNRL